MTADELREALLAEKAALKRARDATDDESEKKAARAAMAAIENTILGLNIAEADQLGAKVDELIEKLDAVLDRNPIDAVSVLGRTITKVRTELSQL